MSILVSISTLMIGVETSVSQEVYVNQAGYLPDRHKLVFFSQPRDSFYVADSASGELFFRGKPSLVSAADPATGLTTYSGDFSSLTRTGSYRIITTGGDTSFPFRISSDVFASVAGKSIKGFYFQRCGVALLRGDAGAWAHDVCHFDDAAFHPSTGRSGLVRTIGGWHDAGDYGKYVVNAGITVGTLLMAYEQFPSRFECDELGIPESGNKIPDILDEAKFELDWLFEMQDTLDGGVYFKISTKNFPGFVMPEDDKDTRYIYQKSSTATGDFAAVTAMAARIFRDYDSVFAARCLSASVSAWRFLMSNPSIVPVGGFRNPSDTYTGEYGDGNDSDERLWAAGELFITTGADSFNTYFRNHYANQGVVPSVMAWPDVTTLAQLDYLVANRPGTDPGVASSIREALLNYCAKLVKASAADGFHVTLQTYQYVWGCNSTALNDAILLINGFELTGNRDYYNAALDQLNYVLGCNMHDMSFVTDVGTKNPMHIHHRPSGADGVAEPVPGLMAGGPDRHLSDPVLRSLYSSSTPPAKCYVDEQGSYASNEICINWNAPFVYVAGYMNESPCTGVVGQLPSGGKEKGMLLNFPNPFNSSTVVSYSIPAGDGSYAVGRSLALSRVTLKVYDMLGRELTTMEDARRAAGVYSRVFNGSGYPSGAYLCRIEVSDEKGKQYSMTRKILLLK